MPYTSDGQYFASYAVAATFGWEEFELYDCDPTEEEDGCGCGYCDRGEDDFYGSSRLHSYSYTPRLEFRGASTGDQAFYGMEFEISCRGDRGVDIAERMGGDLVYLKEDGSVAGFEAVTHPMTYPWAMGGNGADFRLGFPWEMLPALEEAGCYIDTSTNGIHVHVSRDGFGQPGTELRGRRDTRQKAGTASHQYRWMKFIYRNQAMCETIARRRNSSWAMFTTEHRASHLAHVKPELARKLGRTMPCPYIARMGENCYGCRTHQGCDYAGRDGTSERYSAINTTNGPTFEMRIFASTLDPSEAKACLGLVAGSVEYTRQLTAHDVAKRDGWSWDAFTRWADDQGTYSDLLYVAGKPVR